MQSSRELQFDSNVRVEFDSRRIRLRDGAFGAGASGDRRKDYRALGLPRNRYLVADSADARRPAAVLAESGQFLSSLQTNSPARALTQIRLRFDGSADPVRRSKRDLLRPDHQPDSGTDRNTAHRFRETGSRSGVVDSDESSVARR